MTETQSSSNQDFFVFDGLAYLTYPDYADWVDLEISRREYEADPEGFLQRCERVK